MLETLGARVEGNGNVVRIDTTNVNSYEATYDLVRTMRASVLVLGPLLARFGQARVSLPGGCAIGARPINLHLKGLAALGAEITLEHGYVEAKAKRLKGARINFDVSTVGGTEQLMMAAATAKGETILENAAREPEIVDLAEILNKMGARIEGAGTDTIRITGVEELAPASHSGDAGPHRGGHLHDRCGHYRRRRQNPRHAAGAPGRAGVQTAGCRGGDHQ